MVNKITDPFYTTKDGKRTGLGLSLLSQAVEETEGKITIESNKGEGTTIKAKFNFNHPDMKPMGDILSTLKTLIMGNPTIQLIYKHKSKEQNIYFDSFNN